MSLSSIERVADEVFVQLVHEHQIAGAPDLLGATGESTAKPHIHPAPHGAVLWIHCT